MANLPGLLSASRPRISIAGEAMLILTIFRTLSCEYPYLANPNRAVYQMMKKSPQPSSGNPIAPHIFAADPSAHVWPNDPDTVWVYASHDHAGANSFDTMSGYHVFSSKDLVNWTDHGQVLSLQNVSWAASHAWAIDAVFYRGMYYLITCMKDKTNGVFMTGLAISERPEGPFTDMGQIRGSEWGQDPALFLDDDGQPYLFWGHDYLMYGAKLTDDLTAVIPETVVELTHQLDDSFEAPFVNKINGRYYLTYAGIPDRKWPERLYYAVADAPLGPYESFGRFMETFPLAAGTNHQSLVRFKEKWIVFYHSAWGSVGRSENRSLMADYLTIGADGRWTPVVPTATGISGGKPVTSRIWLEAENGAAAGGRLIATRVARDLPGFSGSGYVTGFAIEPENMEAYLEGGKVCPLSLNRASVGSVKVLAQVAFQQRYRLRLRYAADQDTELIVFIGCQKATSGRDKPEIRVKATGPKFQMVDLAEVSLEAGDNTITLHTRGNLDIKVDGFELTPLY
jgi:hypothetical protein